MREHSSSSGRFHILKEPSIYPNLQENFHMATTQRKKRTSKPKPIFASFCGGGFAGVENAIGVLKAMDELGIVPDKLAGGSAGGLVACLYASFGSAAKLEELIKTVDADTWFTPKPWQFIKSLFGFSNYLYDTTGLFEFLKENMTYKAYDKVKVSVTEIENYGTGNEKYNVITVPGTPAHALATMSIPLATPPVEWDGKLHGDGGVKDLIPTPKISARKRYKHIYLTLCPPAGTSTNLGFKKLNQLYALVMGVMDREVDNLRHEWDGLDNVTILDPPACKSGGLLCWSDNFELLESSYQYAKQELIKQLEACEESEE